MIDLEKRYLAYQENSILRKLKSFNNKNITDFTTSDYLNLASSSNLKDSIIRGFDKYGFSSRGSNVVCGYTDETKHFEYKFAKFVNYPKAIFFNSGFMANLAIYSTLFNKNNILFADKNIHASIIDGIKLSQAKLKRFKHQDINHLSEIYSDKNYVVTEGIFSTTGSITNLKQIITITNRLIIDEAHSFGILGEKGRGAINHFNINYKNIPIAVFPLGKGFGGIGAMICTTNKIANYLIQFARSYIYTTALPAFILTAATTQLDNLQAADHQRYLLNTNIKFFNNLAISKNLKLLSTDVSPIKSIHIGDHTIANQLQKELQKSNIFVSCFRYPTVPNNQAILRFSLHSNNTFTEIETSLTAIANRLDNEHI